jgi:pyruvate-formate lyase
MVDTTRSTCAALSHDALCDCQEFFAAGFFADTDAPLVVRMANGVAAHLTHVPLPAWAGTRLYPGVVEQGQGSSELYGAPGSAVYFHYPRSMCWDRERLTSKLEQADQSCRDTLLALGSALEAHPYFDLLPGFNHSSVNFRRILAEGLDSYGVRIRRQRQRAVALRQTERLPFYDALSTVLDGFRTFHGRVTELLRRQEGLDKEEESRRDGLVRALGRVPFGSARTFYEAMVAENLLYFLDGCDSLGRFDQDLIAYYRDDIDQGRLSRPEALALIKDLWLNVERTGGWNVAIGGTAPDGAAGTNELTLLCLEAARGRRGPNLALRLREDAPPEVWDEAFRTLETGCGLPALYGEENYLKSIRDIHLGVREEDLPDYAFGGCTELIVHGKSNCGGADGQLNLALILDRSIHAHLVQCASFEEFYDRFERDLREAVHAEADHINHNYQQKARWQPQVVRSLLIDDCIDEGVEYNAGGARYNWCVVSIGGIGNVADSLQALREVVFDGKELTPAEMVAILAADFRGYEDIRLRLTRCARYGNDDVRVDELASRVSEAAFRTFLSCATWRGGRFVPACVLLNWYADWGEKVGALPDGRRAGEPIADSAGPVQGRDQQGPTAMIASITRIPQHLAPGTLVVNARFSKKLFRGRETRGKLQDLIRSYFRLGGMQMQINVVDQETLKKAIEVPEEYANLIIRIGGYSAHWGSLSPSLRLSVLQRTEHE